MVSPVADAMRGFGLGCEFFNGLEYRRFELDGELVVEIDITDDLRGPAGSVHGGLVTMLVDVAGATCLTRASGRPVATASTSIQYLSAGRVGPMRAIPKLLRASDALGVADVQVVDVGKDSRLMAVAHVTCRFFDADAFVRNVS
jgi:uncharacterized protein (TIGR00369 family)